ncbi:MAG: ribosome maturation factor RimP [Cellulomonadaceae bacterium]|jgi:ribosome maturation factor RimP|nr:ribosome maturation factor RimP [Cellulomonadaceae bacterium]
MSANKGQPRKPAGPGAKVADDVQRVIAPAVAGAGLWLDGVAVSRAGKDSLVRVTVDLPETQTGSLDSDQLTDVSRAISAALDTDDVVPGVYTLEVSTPGLSKPLKDLRQYRRARTRLVTVITADGRSHTGRLTGVEGVDDAATLVFDDGHRIAFADARKGRIELEFNRDDSDNDDDLADADGIGDEPLDSDETFDDDGDSADAIGDTTTTE